MLIGSEGGKRKEKKAKHDGRVDENYSRVCVFLIFFSIGTTAAVLLLRLLLVLLLLLFGRYCPRDLSWDFIFASGDIRVDESEWETVYSRWKHSIQSPPRPRPQIVDSFARRLAIARYMEILVWPDSTSVTQVSFVRVSRTPSPLLRHHRSGT